MFPFARGDWARCAAEFWASFRFRAEDFGLFGDAARLGDGDEVKLFFFRIALQLVELAGDVER